MADAPQEPSDAPPGPPTPSLLIVARKEPDLFRALQQAFGGSSQLRVLRDARSAECRRGARAVPVDRRQRERRRPPRPEEDLRRRPYIFVRPPARRPQD